MNVKLEVLRKTCERAGRGEHLTLLEELFALAAAIPGSRYVRRDIHFDDLALRACEGAYIEAIMDMLHPRVGYILSRSPDGGAAATVCHAEIGDEFSVRARSEPLALCGAICRALHSEVSLTVCPPWQNSH